VSNSWVDSLEKLREFISTNSGVNIQDKIVRIDAQVRPEFYQLFDTILSSFVDEKLGHLIDEVAPLSSSYNANTEILSAQLGLEAILQPPEITELLKNPREKAKSILFDLLFRLLKGKFDVTDFEREGINFVSYEINYYLDFLYLHWSACAVLGVLQPSELLRVPLRHTVAKDVINDQGGEKAAPLKVPPPENSKKLDFQHDPDTMLNMADAIVYSAYMGKYVSLRAGLATALHTASNRSQNREWLPIDNSSIDASLMPIYVADKPDDISLILDNEAICRPDAIICCWGKPPNNTTEAFIHLNKISALVKPKYGIWIITYHEPEYNPDDNVHILHVKADSDLLVPFLEYISAGQSNNG
jgi:hypothetical protein